MWPCLSCMDVCHAWKMLPEVRNVVCKEKREKSPMWLAITHAIRPADFEPGLEMAARPPFILLPGLLQLA